MSNDNDNQVDYAARLFLHKFFVPRPGVDRVGRTFLVKEMPGDDGRSSELARTAQSLSVVRLIRKYANPSDDLFEVKTDSGQHCAVRMQWLRLYWREAAQ